MARFNSEFIPNPTHTHTHTHTQLEVVHGTSGHQKASMCKHYNTQHHVWRRRSASSHLINRLTMTVSAAGYGHISPSTTTGRAITIVYAIFGIPMFLILLADFGKLFTRGIKFLWAFVRRVYYTGSCRKVRRTGPVQVTTLHIKTCTTRIAHTFLFS